MVQCEAGDVVVAKHGDRFLVVRDKMLSHRSDSILTRVIIVSTRALHTGRGGMHSCIRALLRTAGHATFTERAVFALVVSFLCEASFALAPFPAMEVTEFLEPAVLPRHITFLFAGSNGDSLGGGSRVSNLLSASFCAVFDTIGGEPHLRAVVDRSARLALPLDVFDEVAELLLGTCVRATQGANT
jgi:hypothetical protein